MSNLNSSKSINEIVSCHGCHVDRMVPCRKYRYTWGNWWLIVGLQVPTKVQAVSGGSGTHADHTGGGGHGSPGHHRHAVLTQEASSA